MEHHDHHEQSFRAVYEYICEDHYQGQLPIDFGEETHIERMWEEYGYNNQPVT